MIWKQHSGQMQCVSTETIERQFNSAFNLTQPNFLNGNYKQPLDWPTSYTSRQNTKWTEHPWLNKPNHRFISFPFPNFSSLCRCLWAPKLMCGGFFFFHTLPNLKVRNLLGSLPKPISVCSLTDCCPLLVIIQYCILHFCTTSLAPTIQLFGSMQNLRKNPHFELVIVNTSLCSSSDSTFLFLPRDTSERSEEEWAEIKPKAVSLQLVVYK